MDNASLVNLATLIRWIVYYTQIRSLYLRSTMTLTLLSPDYSVSQLTLGVVLILETAPGARHSLALAQTQPLETVVVTARRTAENLRDVPATVNVLTESTIEDAGIETLEDLKSHARRDSGNQYG